MSKELKVGRRMTRNDSRLMEGGKKENDEIN